MDIEADPENEENYDANARVYAVLARVIVIDARAEGSGALAFTGAFQQGKNYRGKSVCILSGGSIDPDKIITILDSPD